jgi:hypothetical protein
VNKQKLREIRENWRAEITDGDDTIDLILTALLEDEPEESIREGNWIPWYGGDTPVSRHTKVKVLFRDLSMNDMEEAGKWEWNHENQDSDKDIIAYQVLPQQPQQQFPPAGMMFQVWDVRYGVGNADCWIPAIALDNGSVRYADRIGHLEYLDWRYWPAPRPWPQDYAGGGWIGTSLGEYFFTMYRAEVGDEAGDIADATIVYVEHEDDA